MTKPMANPTPRAQKLRDLSPTPITRERKKRGASLAGNIAGMRLTGKDTSSAASAAEVDVNKPLTDKQRQFVQHWAKGDSIPSATLRAGFADDGVGYRLVRQPNILAYKATFEAKYEAAAQMTREKVMEGLLEAVDMAKLMSEPASMIQGWKTIGQMCGYFAPVEVKMKIDHTGNLIVDRLNSMSDAELLKVMGHGTQELLGLPDHE